MLTHRIAPMLALLLALFAAPAWAFLDPPYIVPAHPSVGDAISVSIYGGECDAPYVGLEWPPPVTQQGTTSPFILSATTIPIRSFATSA